MLHYLSAREVSIDATRLLTPWGRPLFKLLIVIPSQFGMTPARLVVAVVAGVMVWQTIGLARDLQIARPLLAGPLVLLQPLAFAMAGDTMTEIPAALLIVIAIRLWVRQRRGASCVVMSLLPMLRPEGFFLVPVWGAMVLITGLRQREPWPVWLRRGLLLGTGMALWWIITFAVSGDPLFLKTNWSWPARSYEAYGRGPIHHHLALWPFYCGAALWPVFLLGVPLSVRKKMLLPWIVWLVIIGVHSILYWRGWFASLGLMRIMVTSSAVTALVCLNGWNFLLDQIARFDRTRTLNIVLTAGWLIFGTWVVVTRYIDDPQHLHCLPAYGCADYIKKHRLIPPGGTFFCSDKMLLVPLGYPKAPMTVVWNQWGHGNDRGGPQRNVLAGLPSGAIGVWDNREAKWWFDLDIDQLPALGFEILHREKYIAKSYPPKWWYKRNPGWPEPLEYAVVRKR